MCKSVRYLPYFGAYYANPHAIHETLEPNVQIRLYLQHFGVLNANPYTIYEALKPKMQIRTLFHLYFIIQSSPLFYNPVLSSIL